MRLARQANRTAEAKTAAAVELAASRPVLIEPTHRQVAVINSATAEVTGQAPDLAKYTRTRINGARVLDMIDLGLQHYARWEQDEWRWMTALWIAHTYFTNDEDRLAFAATPRWLAIAPPKQGKSRMLKLIAAMSRNGKGPVTGVVTAPGVRNAIDKGFTVVIDEAHRLFGTRGTAREDLQAVITGGYTPEGGSLNGVGGVNDQSNFGPVALGAQPRIELAGDALEDLLTRSFLVRPQRSADRIPQLDEAFTTSAGFASKAMSYWGAQNRPDPGKKLWPLSGMPDELTDRDYEIASPLIAVGDRAEDFREDCPPGDRFRWADRARGASLMMLTDTGDTSKVMDEIEALIAAMA